MNEKEQASIVYGSTIFASSLKLFYDLIIIIVYLICHAGFQSINIGK